MDSDVWRGNGDGVLQMLGLPSSSLRSFVLDSDPIPRAMLSIDPTFSFFKQWPAVKGILQVRNWFMGQASAAPVVNPARFLYDNVGDVYLIKWTVGQGHKVSNAQPGRQRLPFFCQLQVMHISMVWYVEPVVLNQAGQPFQI